MDQSKKVPAEGQNPQQPQKRAWVTPAFEQVPLKDALTGPGAANDGISSSS